MNTKVKKSSLACHNDIVFFKIFRILVDDLNFVQIIVTLRQALVSIIFNGGFFPQKIFYVANNFFKST